MKCSISRQLLEPHFPSANLVEDTSTCIICRAVYAPSRLHAYLLQAPPIALESAFMSMCHFCYRCRRPSCPNCWDNIHGVCVQCAYETHIPFRVQISPLEGKAPTPPLDLPVYERSISSHAVNEHPDLFQEAFSAPSIDTIGTRPDPPSTPPVRFPAQSAGTSIVSSPRDVDRIKTRPERSSASNIDRIKTRPEQSQSLYIDQHAPNTSISTVRKQKIARILMSLSLLLLSLLVVMIAVAFLSGDANLFMKNVLDIDIRATFTSLWHFLNSLF